MPKHNTPICLNEITRCSSSQDAAISLQEKMLKVICIKLNFSRKYLGKDAGSDFHQAQLQP